MKPGQEKLLLKAKESLKTSKVLFNEGIYVFAVARSY